jgi:hypothetical protein
MPGVGTARQGTTDEQYSPGLQRIAGNRALLRMLYRTSQSMHNKPSTGGPMLQRRCSCGAPLPCNASRRAAGSASRHANVPNRCSACQEEETSRRLSSDSDEDVIDFPRQDPSDDGSSPTPAFDAPPTPAPAPGVFPPSPPPPGPVAPAADCCTQALNKGLDKGDWGGIICCNNSKSTCVWTSNINKTVTNATAQGIVAGCVQVHEDTHLNQVDCTGAAVERPNFKPGVDPKAAECNAYKAELACYNANIGNCGTDADCTKQVQKESDFAKKQIKKFC